MAKQITVNSESKSVTIALEKRGDINLDISRSVSVTGVQNLSAGNNISLSNTTGNITVSTTNNISVSGNITASRVTATTFVGNLQGNISGNIVVPGANTNIIFNNNGNAGASANLAFDQDTNLLSVIGSANITSNVTANAEVIRETTRVFSYQPGKSLLMMSSFAMETPKANVRQRVGYYGAENGIYFENDGATNYFVLRSNTTGTITETKVAQTDWSIDKFDGTGYSSQSGGAEHAGGIDVSKTNILWMDVEWLGVGDVRCGFVVDGKMVPAHVFHNDNRNTVPYMTTASLPLRYEIKNTGITASNSTLKQISKPRTHHNANSRKNTKRIKPIRCSGNNESAASLYVHEGSKETRYVDYNKQNDWRV